MKVLLTLITLLFIGCATHSPMSEMVMFNKKRNVSGSTDSLANSVFALSGSLNNEEPDTDNFNAKDDQDYVGNEEIGIGDWSLNGALIVDDIGALGMSLGGATGVDITVKTSRNMYATAIYSLNNSGRLIYQYRLFNEDNIGFSSGIFVGVESKYFYSECSDEPCGRYSGPDGSTQLVSVGWRNRFLIREKYKRGIGLSGNISIGYLPEIERTFIGFSFSFVGF